MFTHKRHMYSTLRHTGEEVKEKKEKQLTRARENRGVFRPIGEVSRERSPLCSSSPHTLPPLARRRPSPRAQHGPTLIFLRKRTVGLMRPPIHLFIPPTISCLDENYNALPAVSALVVVGHSRRDRGGWHSFLSHCAESGGRQPVACCFGARLGARRHKAQIALVYCGAD